MIVRKWGVQLSQIFHGLYCLLWIPVLIGVFFAGIIEQKNIVSYLMWLLFDLLLLTLAVVYVRRKGQAFQRLRQRVTIFLDAHSLVFVGAFIIGLQFLLQLYVGSELMITPSNDRNVIFRQASEIALNGQWRTSAEWNYYFLRYPNNNMLLMIEAAYFSMLHFFKISNFLYANMILNILAIDLAIIFMSLLVFRKWGKKAAAALLFASFFFLPFYTYAPFVYTDTLTLPIVAGALLLYQYLEESFETKSKKTWLILLALSLLLWFGYELKATVAILAVAMSLHLIVAKRLWKGLVCAVAMFSVLFGCITGYSRLIKTVGIVDYQEYDTENFPYTHWVMMGLSKPFGYYKKSEREFTSSFLTKKEKEAANRQVIAARLKEYQWTGLLWHQYVKACATWHDGQYDMASYLKKDPLKKSWLHEAVLSSGTCYSFYAAYCNLYHYAMLLLFSWSLQKGVRKGPLDSATVWKLSLFGLFLFLMIWETRPRYVMHMTPALFLTAVSALEQHKTKIQNQIDK